MTMKVVMRGSVMKEYHFGPLTLEYSQWNMIASFLFPSAIDAVRDGSADAGHLPGYRHGMVRSI